MNFSLFIQNAGERHGSHPHRRNIQENLRVCDERLEAKQRQPDGRLGSFRVRSPAELEAAGLQHQVQVHRDRIRVFELHTGRGASRAAQYPKEPSSGGVRSEFGATGGSEPESGGDYE